MEIVRLEIRDMWIFWIFYVNVYCQRVSQNAGLSRRMYGSVVGVEISLVSNLITYIILFCIYLLQVCLL